jgi:alginate O-acetyltransferase complex protein AlgI
MWRSNLLTSHKPLMAFTTYDFLLFFLITLALYWVLRRREWQNLLLLVASFVFYGWVHPWYALLLGLSSLADYFITLGMRRKHARVKLLLALSIVLNLGVLAFFKYYNFFSSDLVQALSALGIHADLLLINILLPAGLSFYTLKKLGYVLDVSRGILEPVRDPVAFGLYVSFFPQVVSGPIDRPQKLLPQIQEHRPWKAEYFNSAWPLLVMGFFKKLVIAEGIRPIVDRIFGINEPSVLLLFAGGLGFTLQILADFSAYTDLARGVAFLLGFDTTENFRSPYLSLSPTDFWNRWHITLSTWLRDYIFFPLRRALLKRKEKLPGWLIMALPPLLTLLVSGIWHGAGWTYVVWGLWYGILIVAYQAVGIGGNWKPAGKFKTLLAWFIMFLFIVFGWIIFRSHSLPWLWNALTSNLGISSPDQVAVVLVTLSLTLVYSLPLFLKTWLDRRFSSASFLHAAFYALATIAVIVYTSSGSPDFIYFQF